MEKEPIMQGIPEAMVNQEGPSEATKIATPLVIKKRPPPQSRPKQTVKRYRRKVLTAQEVQEQEQEEEEEQDKLKLEAAMAASKNIELEEQLQEARVHLEQQMNLVSTQQEELSQLHIRLENSTAIRVAMGNNAIRKDDAIEEARQPTAQTIEALEESVGQLTQELAETKHRLVAAQTIDLEVHTRENAQRERLQAELIQERQTIVSLQAEMDRMKIELDEIQQMPPPQAA
jgi:hypothetical protein